MKVAGILALLLAAVIGIYAVADFARNYHDQEVYASASEHEEAEGLFGVAREDSKMAERLGQDQRFDGVLGIVAAASLIAGTAMFSQSRKAKKV